ncbi:Uncharacterized protein SCF082_LOCUS14989, partial [Durusdinium trenchii]
MLPKKRRLLPEIGDCLVALDAVADAGEVLCDIPVVNARATKKLSTMPTLCISKKLGAVVKNTSGEVTLPEGTVLCGFGKAKFQECPKDASTLDPDTQFIFEVNGDTFGTLDNTTGTMNEILKYAKETKPANCKVCYHKASQDPEGNWALEKEHNVVFTILKEDANLKYSQSQAGKLLLPALSCWESKACAVGWNFKWSLNGIQPQRAVVMVTQDITIPTNKAFIF